MKRPMLIAAAAALAFACSSKSKTPAAPAPLNVDGKDRRISRAMFSADGRRVYSLVTGLAEHTGAQIYETDPRTKQDKRLTWHDGDVESFDAGPGGELVYASSTDELKERPHPSQRPPEQGPPTEIYLSDSAGEDIRRLTQHPGFDGDVAMSPKGDRVVFITQQKDRWVLQRHARKGPLDVIANKPGWRRFSPSIGADGRTAWLETSLQDAAVTQMRIENRGPALLPELRLRGLRRAPAPRGWIAWDDETTGSRVLFVDSGPDCQKTLWTAPAGAKIVGADGATDPARLLVLVDDGKTVKLQTQELGPATFACETAAAADKIKK